jgi:hypothetical protein
MTVRGSAVAGRSRDGVASAAVNATMDVRSLVMSPLLALGRGEAKAGSAVRG